MKQLSSIGVILLSWCVSTFSWDGKDVTVFSLANNLANLVYQRFQFYNAAPYQFFLGIENINSESWEVLKYKFLEKISSENRSQFLMIFGGSSVTAGEDNTFLSAYPQVFERRMKPVLSALGVDLVVRDIAQTANQCIPSELCYNAMGGENADFIGWEQSFNCGREPAMFEIIARIAGFQGAVLHFEASGTELVDGCADSKTKPYRVSEDWSPEVDEDIQAQLKMQKTDHRALNEAAKEPLADLPYSPYIPNKEAVIAFKKLLTLWGDKANSIIRFSSPLGEKYKRVAPHGFNLWASSGALCMDPKTGKACNAVDMLGTCYDKGGPKWIVHELGLYVGKMEYRRTHHPPAGWHLLRAELMAYNYLHVLLDAVFTMQADVVGGKKVAELHDAYAAHLKLLQPAMPEAPIHKTPSNHAHFPPKCFTDFEPHYNPKYTLSETIVGLHPGWEYHEGLPNKLEAKIKWGLLDIRPGWIAKPSVNATISVEVTLENGDKMLVCGYKHKESLMHSHIYLDFDVSPFKTQTERDAYVFNPSGPRTHIWPKRAHIGGDTECTLLSKVPSGNHILTISTGDEAGFHSDGKVHGSAITHIITY